MYALLEEKTVLNFPQWHFSDNSFNFFYKNDINDYKITLNYLKLNLR